MKKTIVLVLILLVSGVLAAAQTNYHFVRARIPFSFQVNGQTLSPGTYDFCWNRSFVATVRLADRESPSTPVRFAKITDIRDEGRDETPKVIFYQVEGRYFLSAINQPNEGLVNLSTTPERRRNEKLADKEVHVIAVVGH